VLCVSVTLNGVPQLVAGALSVESIEASVGLCPELKEAWLRIAGVIFPDGQPPADAHVHILSPTLTASAKTTRRAPSPIVPHVQDGRRRTSPRKSNDIARTISTFRGIGIRRQCSRAAAFSATKADTEPSCLARSRSAPDAVAGNPHLAHDLVPREQTFPQ
jgi:hypothetical protein